MKIQIDRKWLEDNVFNHSINGDLWKQVILDHNCTAEYKFDINFKNRDNSIEFYGVRVCFKDKRLYYHKLYIGVPKGSYKIVVND